MPASASRRPIAFVSAVTTAAALGATAFALPALAAQKASGAPALELKDGTLDWGFKESFRKYLASPVAPRPHTEGAGPHHAAGHRVLTILDR
ncbi:HtaA domain-containing protein, partial [Streptomyces sp. NPDC127084]|uniref:HtaA domain-containing protein n=1 Tax=Streptomyces sp. NPDC127084 TaxID=3347133 RepID=UPI003652D18B